ncbi:MAG: peptide deformylase [Candidatus Tokpelaia sp. JSC085]|nr:MAG: peptide deformylase [Candidatus Tokpelaia sp. JSC085]
MTGRTIDAEPSVSYLKSMSVKPLIILPDASLRKVSEPVVAVDGRIRRLIDDMLESMYHALGIGLAAVQVGELLRLLVVDIAGKDVPKNPQVFINPEITWFSEQRRVHEEGCLSVPGYYAEIERPEKIYMKYLDRSGKLQEIEAHGLLATCLQHEIDHLNGVLFIDHVSRLKRDMVLRSFKKRSRERHVSI